MRWTGVLLCVCALWWPASVSASPDIPSSVPRLRPVGPRAVKTLAVGMARSATFQGIVDALERLDVVVYIHVAVQPAGSAAGETRFLGASPLSRFVTITLDRDMMGSALVAMLGHELQHALEVAQSPEVRDRESFKQYFVQHGTPRQTLGEYETRAALEVGGRVRDELATTSPTPVVQ